MYRDGYEAARAALDEEVARLREQAEGLEAHRPELPPSLWSELDELRGALEPTDTTVDAVRAAQAAAERYARKLRSATDLAAQLRGERARRAAMPFWRKVAVDARAVPWSRALLVGVPLLGVGALVVVLGPAAALSGTQDDTETCVSRWQADPATDVADCEGGSELVLPWLLPWTHDEASEVDAATARRVALARLDHTTAADPHADDRAVAGEAWLALRTTPEHALLDRGIVAPLLGARSAAGVTAARITGGTVAASSLPEAVALRCGEDLPSEVPPGDIAGYPARWALHWACGWEGPEPAAPSTEAWARLELRRFADLSYAAGRRKALAVALRRAGAPALPLAARVLSDPAWTDAERARWLEGLAPALPLDAPPEQLLLDADAWADPAIYLAAAEAAAKLPAAPWEARWRAEAALAQARLALGEAAAMARAQQTLRRATQALPSSRRWTLATHHVALGAAEAALPLLDAAPPEAPTAMARAYALLALGRPAEALPLTRREAPPTRRPPRRWLEMAAATLAHEPLRGFGEAPAEFPGLPDGYGPSAHGAWVRALRESPEERRWQRLQAPRLRLEDEPDAAPLAVLAAELAAGTDQEVFLDRLFAELASRRPILAALARRTAARWRGDEAAAQQAEALARRMSPGADERRAWLATLVGWR